MSNRLSIYALAAVVFVVIGLIVVKTTLSMLPDSHVRHDIQNAFDRKKPQWKTHKGKRRKKIANSEEPSLKKRQEIVVF